MTLSKRAIKMIRGAGAAVFVVGSLPLAWALYRFESLPNYLRLAAFVPFSFGVTLLGAGDYGDGWASLEPRQKGRALAWLFVPFMLLAGALWWYFNDPTAKA